MRATSLFRAATVLLMLAASPIIAQDELGFPDTLAFAAPAEVQHVATLDGIGSVVAQLPEVNAQLIKVSAAWYGQRYALAVATSNGYDLHPMLSDETLDDVQVSTANVRGNGHLQVVACTKWYAGHSGWEHAIHEYEWAITVWDIEARSSVLRLTTGRAFEEWTNIFAPDSTGLIPFEQRAMLSSTGEGHCETYEASFTPGHLILLRTDDCPQDEGGLDLESKAGVRIEYVLGAEGWVKVK